MVRTILAGVLSLGMVGTLPLLGGCDDDTVKHEKEVKVSDGVKTVDETTVKKDIDDGMVKTKKTTEHTVDKVD